MFEFVSNFFKWLLKIREPTEQYPNDWAVVEYTSHASTLGVKGDKNKIIRRFFVNRFGRVEEKRYRYSQERVFALQKIHKVPIYDKTQVDVKFPVYARVLPGEVQFISGR